jgi:hypothetical protein
MLTVLSHMRSVSFIPLLSAGGTAALLLWLAPSFSLFDPISFVALVILTLPLFASLVAVLAYCQEHAPYAIVVCLTIVVWALVPVVLYQLWLLSDVMRFLRPILPLCVIALPFVVFRLTRSTRRLVN